MYLLLLIFSIPLFASGTDFSFKCEDGRVTDFTYRHKYPTLPKEERKTDVLYIDDLSILEKTENQFSGLTEVQLNYPFNTPYQYTTGINPIIKRKYSRQKLKKLKLMIETAVLQNADPYMVLSIGMMESPGDVSVVNNHFHDTPYGMTFGCKVDNQTIDKKTNQVLSMPPEEEINFKKFVESYRTVNALDSKYLDHSGTSLACVQVKKDRISDYGTFIMKSGEEVLEKDQNSCCIKIPIKFDAAVMPPSYVLPTRYHGNHVANLMSFFSIMKFFRQLQNTPARSESAHPKLPEYKLQRYNGYSRSSGQGMSHLLATYRLGLDTYKNPAYGLEVMDFYVNTFMSNPIINYLVAEGKKKYQTNPKNILCEGRNPGRHTLPINHYMKLHAHAEKYPELEAAYKSSPEPKLDPKRFRPLLEEVKKMRSPKAMAAMKEIKAKLPKDFESILEVVVFKGEPLAKKDQKNFHAYFRHYFTHPHLHQIRRTVEATSKQDKSTYTWEVYPQKQYLELLRAYDKVDWK